MLLTQKKQFIFILGTILSLLACGPQFVRGGQSKEFENAAMSTRLDRKDLELMFKQATQSMSGAGIMKHWKALSRDGQQATLAVLSIENETSEHVDSAMMTLLKKLETTLINEGTVTVVSRSSQPELLKELRVQGGAAFDQERVAVMGRQLGAQYFLTGKLYDIAEKSLQGRRVQYFLFMQVIEVETGAIKWQSEVEVLKGLTAG